MAEIKNTKTIFTLYQSQNLIEDPSQNPIEDPSQNPIEDPSQNIIQDPSQNIIQDPIKNKKQHKTIEQQHKTIEQLAKELMSEENYPFKRNSLYWEEFDKDENVGPKRQYYQFIVKRYDLHQIIIKKKGTIKFNKMILECKHSRIIWWTGFSQIIIIVISGIMSLVESIVAHFSYRNKRGSKMLNDFKTIFPMVIGYLILMISSITKYYKLDEQREKAALILLELGICLNKLLSHQAQLFNIYTPGKDWDNIIHVFDTNTEPLYSETMLKIGNILPEEKSLYYKNKIKRDVLNMKVIDDELMAIDTTDIYPSDVKTEVWFLYLLKRIFCPKKSTVRYRKFIKKYRKNKPDKHWDPEEELEDKEATLKIDETKFKLDIKTSNLDALRKDLDFSIEKTKFKQNIKTSKLDALRKDFGSSVDDNIFKQYIKTSKLDAPRKGISFLEIDEADLPKVEEF